MEARFVAAHAFAIFVHTICALYAFITPHAYKTHIPSELARVSYGVGVYYTVVETMDFSIPSVILLHGMVAVVTVFFHACVYIPSHYFYGKLIWSQGFFPIRWFEYGVTCTLMTISSVASAGTGDFTFILSAIFFGVGLQSLGAAIEQRKETVYFLLYVGFMISLGVSTPTIWYLLSSKGVPAPQVLEFLSYAFYYALFPINCAIDAIYRKGRFVETDWIYIVLSLSSKFGLFWLQVGEVERNVSNGRWPDVQIYALGVVLPLVILAFGIYLTPKIETIQTTQPPSEKTTLLRRACTFRVLPKPEVIKETTIVRHYLRNSSLTRRR